MVAKSRKFQIFSEDLMLMEVNVRPREVQLETIRGKFGKCEVEDAAENLLKFFQIKNMWHSFFLQDLLVYCKQVGFNPNMMLFGLICPWVDDGGLGSLRESQDFLIMNSDGSLCITSNFINKLLEK
jgi:hypothetical protein